MLCPPLAGGFQNLAISRIQRWWNADTSLTTAVPYVAQLAPGATGALSPDGSLNIQTGFSYLGTTASQGAGEPITAPFTGTFNLATQIAQVRFPTQSVATGRLPNMIVSYSRTTSAPRPTKDPPTAAALHRTCSG